MKTMYATKAWKDDATSVLKLHRSADLIIGNNFGSNFEYMGETGEPYYLPEREAVHRAVFNGFDYILWYAGDVIPPKEDWTLEALPLLEKYPIVSPFWREPYEPYLEHARKQEGTGFVETDFGFETYMFSDHAYFARVETMSKVDYQISHPIADKYPKHGGNSFERRVAQYLAFTDKKVAVLKNYSYEHITRDRK